MTKFRIVPKFGATIERTTTVFERAISGYSRSWTVTGYYAHGFAYCSGQEAPGDRDTVAVCDPRLGYSLGDAIAFDFTFDDSIAEDDQAQIKEGWQFAQTYGIDLSRWIIEEDFIKITGKFAIDYQPEESEVECAA